MWRLFNEPNANYGMDYAMIHMIKKFFNYKASKDMSQHRVHTTKYEDLCM